MAQNCMVFNLDYDRRSDLDDSVGYWFAQPTGPASCRVFYSCEVKLRGWVPGPVYNVLTKQALKQATTWVSSEATKEWALIQNGCSPQQRFTRFVSNVRTRMDNLRLEPPRVQLPDRFLTTAFCCSPPRLGFRSRSWGRRKSLIHKWKQSLVCG